MSFSEFERISEDEEQDEWIVILPSTGRGLRIPDVTEIKMPVDFFAEVRRGVHNVQSLAHREPQPAAPKGRAQLISQDQRRCLRPGPDITLPDNCLHSENRVSEAESVVLVNQESLKSDEMEMNKSNFDEDFPPLARIVSGR